MPAWDFEPSVVLGLAVWSGAYVVAAGPVARRYQGGRATSRARQAAFHLGTLIALIALTSPLDTLGDHTLFSAHMGQHILLTFVAAPLWVVGTPGWLLRRVTAQRRLGWLAHPLVAITVFNGAMWAWHLPAAYDAALRRPPVHIAEHLVFIGAALTGWLPALRGEQEGGLEAAQQLAYLIPSLFACTALAALITLSPIQLYSFYGKAAMQWGLSPLVDQQVGGLIMWLPGDMLYLFLIARAAKTLLDRGSTETQQVNL